MELLAIQRALWVACLAAQVLLIGAIFQRRIAKGYSLFLAFLLMEAGSGVVLLEIPYETRAYAYAYRIYAIGLVVVQGGAVAELFERIAKHLPVIRRIRFVLAGGLLALTGLASLATVRPYGGLWKYPQTFAIYVAQFETTVLAVSLLLMWWFLTRFMSLTPAVSGNVALHWRLLTIYFAINGFVELVATLEGTDAVRYFNAPMLAGNLACFLAWIRGLRPAGELPPPKILSPEEAAARQMLRQTILEHVKHTGRQ
ncbi:MAG TPA: hypothetical protein VMH80_15755 [Bryobacteraceae bacterium]|nr:hypothetical protein [Bryobacteraceae bacterium]